MVVHVDGLNVISGERGQRSAGSQPGRMYVLDPWDQTEIQGWRTSLEEVRRFTFVDEQRSYAARSGKANSKMGWVEVAVYRERGRSVGSIWPLRSERDSRDRAPAERQDERMRATRSRPPRDRHRRRPPRPAPKYALGRGGGEARRRRRGRERVSRHGLGPAHGRSRRRSCDFDARARARRAA